MHVLSEQHKNMRKSGKEVRFFAELKNMQKSKISTQQDAEARIHLCSSTLVVKRQYDKMDFMLTRIAQTRHTKLHTEGPYWEGDWCTLLRLYFIEWSAPFRWRELNSRRQYNVINNAAPIHLNVWTRSHYFYMRNENGPKTCVVRFPLNVFHRTVRTPHHNTKK